MKILWLATKAPWPPIDGGRLLLWNTLRALSGRGHEITLVAAVDSQHFDRDEVAGKLAGLCRPRLVMTRPRSPWTAAVEAQLTRRPLTTVRHGLASVRREVAVVLAEQRFDVVQLEQVQAYGLLPRPPREGRLADGTPVVLRAQNVESDLWAATAAATFWRRPWLRLEARRLALWEGRAMRDAAATVALSAEDAERLSVLAGGPKQPVVVPAPFDSELEAADHPLSGELPIILFGSQGWWPNRDGVRWFVDQIWPAVREALPRSVLHIFGQGLGRDEPRVVHHQPPVDSRLAMAPNAVLAVPLNVASGVRIKILEAWARGVPVVATPAAAGGLGTEDGVELDVARDAREHVAAFTRLLDPALREQRIAAGRRRIRIEHALPLVAERFETIYTGLSYAGSCDG